MRELGAAGLLLTGLLMVPWAGCLCDAEHVEFDVSVSRAGEMARTLPMLVSQKTHIVGIPLPIPDSHGYLDIKIGIPHPNITRILVSDLQVLLTVDGRSMPLRLVAIDSEGRWIHDEGNRTWSGHFEDGETARVWWTVDRERVDDMGDIVLQEGRPYALMLRSEWTADSCSFSAEGVIDQTFAAVVRASANAKTFESTGSPLLDARADKFGFRANYTTKSGVAVNVDSSTAVALVVAKGGLAAAIVPKVSWTVNGLPGSAVKAGDTLATFSASETNPTVYARSGTVLPGNPPGTDRVFVLVQDVTYRATDGSLSTLVDGFAFADNDG